MLSFNWKMENQNHDLCVGTTTKMPFVGEKSLEKNLEIKTEEIKDLSKTEFFLSEYSVNVNVECDPFLATSQNVLSNQIKVSIIRIDI